MCLAQGPQRSDACEARTPDPLVSSQALYYWATALPKISCTVRLMNTNIICTQNNIPAPLRWERGHNNKFLIHKIFVGWANSDGSGSTLCFWVNLSGDISILNSVTSITRCSTPHYHTSRSECLTENYFSTKIYFVGTQKNCLNETVLLRTQNMCLNWWIWKWSQFYAQNFCS